MSKKITLISGDAENISFKNEEFDLVTIGFGVRNFQNLKKGLKESYRVLKPGGKLIVLETSVPENSVIRFFYFLFSFRIFFFYHYLMKMHNFLYLEILSDCQLEFLKVDSIVYLI